MQGVVFRPGDARFDSRSLAEAVANALGDPDCVMVNRNRGSGTRILIDGLLSKGKPANVIPPGYHTEAKSHNAVVAAVAQSRADWGVAIATAADQQQLGFIPIQEEHYDFVIPVRRVNYPPVEILRDLLQDASVRHRLKELGFLLQ